MIKIKKGLDIPIQGLPKQLIEKAKPIKQVALLGRDYLDLEPHFKVRVGEEVKIGQALFEDKTNPGIIFTSPASGKVAEIKMDTHHRLESIVIDSEGEKNIQFTSFKSKPINDLKPAEIQQLLIESGEWTSFRTRPFSKVPKINSRPSALFVTATDTNPLAANPEIVLNERKEYFQAGVNVLAKFLECQIFVCVTEKQKWQFTEKNIIQKKIKGPHPAGNVGTHIHHLLPVSLKSAVWHIGYQDVIAIGGLFLTGTLYLPRVISLAGPQVKVPRLLNTQRGVNLLELTYGELSLGRSRIISGSILNGKFASTTPYCYLGRYHNQVSVIKEESSNDFLGWYGFGIDKYSYKNVYLSKIFFGRRFPFTTNSAGSERPIYPLGIFEKILPMDIQPTFLFKSLVGNKLEEAKKLGCLELDEEDLALCTFVDPSKNDYGVLLRSVLNQIEKGAE
ncbi:MAG: Na(+)-translocating NADH-quinone reductase subunit A [Bacteriovoracaceae bacterium]|nr:Na(+)-translocating NADH-quinone reductase subunit A [Bacteriovoracaceae bacterium]